MSLPAGDGSARALPMFPLGTVLLPGMALPLRVFEPRYRAMMDVVLAEEPPTFGVVLIERGSEVGGGDVRTGVGCTAQVHRCEPLPGGELAVVAVGAERVRVEQWLPDDPFPRAVVSPWPDEGDSVDLVALERLGGQVLEVVALAARLGGGRPPERIELSGDVVRRTYELATLAPLGALDRLRVLSVPRAAERIEVLAELVHEQRILLEARDRLGDG